MNSVTYLNGNVLVTWEKGIKTRRTLRIGQKPEVEFPESLDIQITGKCKYGCPFCYNSSGPAGRTCNPDSLIKALEPLPKDIPIELALGGGSLGEAIEETEKICRWAEGRGYLVRGTFKAADFLEHSLFIKRNFDTFGISIMNAEEINNIEKEFLPVMFLPVTTIVYHIILGIFPIGELKKIEGKNILILGLKQMGRAKELEINELEEWKKEVKRIIFTRRCTLAFDNLALEQLSLKESLPKSMWDIHYQGGEFTNTMFVDAVNEKFAPSSIDTEKAVSWKDNNIIQYFNENKNNWI